MINYIIRMQAYTVRYGVQVVIENRKSTSHTLNNALLHCMDAYWINKIITQLQQRMVGMKKKNEMMKIRNIQKHWGHFSGNIEFVWTQCKPSWAAKASNPWLMLRSMCKPATVFSVKYIKKYVYCSLNTHTTCVYRISYIVMFSISVGIQENNVSIDRLK